LIKKIKSSISLKVFLYIAGLLLTTSLIIYGVVMVVMPTSYKSELAGQFTNNMSQLLMQLEKSNYEDGLADIYHFCFENHASITLESKTKKEKCGTFDDSEVNDSNKGPMMISALTTFQFKDSNEVYTLSVAVSEKPVNQITELLLKMFPWILLFIMIISFIGALFCSRFLTKPIIQISNISQKMSTLELSSRCDIHTSDEIGILAGSLNRMAHNLDTALTDLQATNEKLQLEINRERRQEKQRRDFFAAVSHELKTPITIIKGQLEGMIHNVGMYKDRDEYLRKSLKTAGSMEHLVQEILTVSKIEADGFQLSRMETDLSQLVSSCCRSFEGLAEDKKIQMLIELERKIVIQADKTWLHKAISNVINNAVFHSPVGAEIKIQLVQNEGRGSLIIENSGIHIDEEHREQLFTPFYRVEQSHSRHTGGSGLGLYITKTIFDLHSIACRIENSDHGVIFIAEFETK